MDDMTAMELENNVSGPLRKRRKLDTRNPSETTNLIEQDLQIDVTKSASNNQLQILKKTPKSSTERTREFRARKRLLKEQENLNSIGVPSSEDSKDSSSSAKKNKTSAERTRKWRERKGLLRKSPRKTRPKTAAERSREYRQRKRIKNNKSNAEHHLITTSKL
ncbi:hypothetical protein PV325_001749 [Microctonus aethiopoides]|nr:hypothetical protein PV325_001749 [Microctonus aethiopoides]